MTTTDDRTTRTRINAQNWRDFAACKNSAKPDIWFPLGNTGSALTQIEALKSFCNEWCPAIEFCRDWALDTNQEAGVWGGMSEDERKAIKRREARLRLKEAERQAPAEQAVSS